MGINGLDDDACDLAKYVIIIIHSNIPAADCNKECPILWNQMYNIKFPKAKYWSYSKCYWYNCKQKGVGDSPCPPPLLPLANAPKGLKAQLNGKARIGKSGDKSVRTINIINSKFSNPSPALQLTHEQTWPFKHLCAGDTKSFKILVLP